MRDKDELWQLLVEDGLVGPWSWSDVHDHTALLIAYGMARRNSASQEDMDALLKTLREKAFHILSGKD